MTLTIDNSHINSPNMKDCKPAEVISLESARTVLFGADSGNRSRLLTALTLLPHMEDATWRRALGEIWMSCGDLWLFHKSLKRILGTSGPIPEMMNDEELRYFENLPPEVTIYRGSNRGAPMGASWTLSRDRAAKFPFVGRYRTDNPLLYKARVSKANVLAVKMESGHIDVITFSARVTSRNALKISFDESGQPDGILIEPLTSKT